MTRAIESLPPLGLYRHYKGVIYEATGYAKDSNADSLIDQSELGSFIDRQRRGEIDENVWPLPLGERLVMIYRPLQLDGKQPGPVNDVRTIEDFTKLVCGDADHLRYGQSFSGIQPSCVVPRFQYLGPVLTEGILREAGYVGPDT